ncbi:Hsp20/alpha crystallin family protein [Halalkalirubrum salinum]|uniref:Hsp20/alpha crystallin family protein n=1 Tax=Halalkalirubrum salinum TaxID=2563889 RepID=UPI0010FB33A5|nr:Hsp20/alpha crystallin family protein [Halalkalirubrum salinum]
MNSMQRTGRDEQFLRQYEYGDEWILAADIPVEESSIDVDIVGTTAIVVIDNGNQVTETELELPGPDATVDIANGVLTITVAK